MNTYVLMTKLGQTALGDGQSRQKQGQEWKKKVERLVPGIRWVAHYALLGPYDFMDVYEAPDDRTAMKVSLLSRAEGAVSAESWPAVEYEDFLGLYREVEKEHGR